MKSYAFEKAIAAETWRFARCQVIREGGWNFTSFRVVQRVDWWALTDIRRVFGIYMIRG
jgi:putative component of membrane protein insertase Oxa1/YidC/SpoIIIJ protein YidD